MKYLYGLLFLLLNSLLFLAGCSPSTTSDSIKLSDCCNPYIEVPIELRSEDALANFIETVRPQFKGRKIYIDPGHGGEDRRSKGRNKLITEADINLYTSLALRDFLTAAGAEVIMSRTTDKTVALRARSELANMSCADIFVSVHHNAPGSEKDSWTNYTSTYYHALETDYEYEPMERDIAKYVQRDLSYAMRNPGGLGSFDGTYSDYIIYPKSGFSVLRHTNIPAILVECSFFSHAYEEKKLADKKYNRIEAFGIFRGLSRYLRNSIPLISIFNTECNKNNLTVTLSVTDSLKLQRKSLQVLVNKQKYDDVTFKNNQIVFTLPFEYNKPNTVKVLIQNERGNYSFPFEHTFTIQKSNKE